MTADHPRTVYSLLSDSALSHPGSTAIRFVQDMKSLDDTQAISYSSLLKCLHRAVRMMRGLTGKERPVVSILIPNIPQAHVILWGAEVAGIANPLNPLLSDEALFELMSKAKTDLVLAIGPAAGCGTWDKASKAAQRLPNQPRCLPVGSSGEIPCFESILSEFSDEPLSESECPASSDICAYFHTGGTTGYPKLACHTHANQASAALAVAQRIRLGPTDVTVNGLPIFHVAGAIVNSLGAFAAASQMVLPTALGFRNPEAVHRHWQMVERFGITVSAAIPTSMAALIDVPVGDCDISTLRFLISGGAPVPFRLHELAQARVGRPLYQGYGMTESAGVAALPNLHADPVPGAVGHVAAPVKVTIIDGEICLKGDTVFAGYLGLPSPVSDDGWLRTGDLGHVDEAGYLYVTGRVKDLIIRSGHNIDPALIESCLEKHPEVALAAAVGMPDTYAGELPVAFVQLRKGSAVTADELIAFAAERIDERPACPKRIVILPSLPLTAVGKIYKPELREAITVDVVREKIGEKYEGVAVTAAHTDQGRLYVDLAHVSDEAMRWCSELMAKLNVDVRFNGSTD
ncbi:AMP-binding protein [Pseudomonas sp. SGAir0191]|uniref:AMP-binding protein n=1 Tax=Pseudomonas putida group TaxID=136845 RepID=UPI000C2C059A|nr:AMP-binding protein [Pseudomonas sp. SGAir0191]AUA33345.1 AMP-binding protein [Pseudomonas sp. SGAir0191]